MLALVVVVVTIIAVELLSVETLALGYKYFLLVSLTFPTTSPVSFNFAHQTIPKELLLRAFDNIAINMVFCDSVQIPSLKFIENFTVSPLGIIVIVITIVVLTLLIITLIVMVVVIFAVVVSIYCLLLVKKNISSSPGGYNLTQLATAVTLLICPFDSLYIHILLEIFISMLSTL